MFLLRPKGQAFLISSFRSTDLHMFSASKIDCSSFLPEPLLHPISNCELRASLVHPVPLADFLYGIYYTAVALSCWSRSLFKALVLCNKRWMH